MGLKKHLQHRVQHWQYSPYGSRRHNFAFYWLTGNSLTKSVLAGIRRPYRYVRK
jgi:hypothetical protein